MRRGNVGKRVFAAFEADEANKLARADESVGIRFGEVPVMLCSVPAGPL